MKNDLLMLNTKHYSYKNKTTQNPENNNLFNNCNELTTSLIKLYVFPASYEFIISVWLINTSIILLKILNCIIQ